MARTHDNLRTGGADQRRCDGEHLRWRITSMKLMKVSHPTLWPCAGLTTGAILRLSCFTFIPSVGSQ